MIKLVIIAILLSSRLFAQQADSTANKFDRIFGCSCCADTLHSYRHHKMTYVLVNNRAGLIAYRSHKKVWVVDFKDLFKIPDVQCNCVEFFMVGKVEVLRLYADNKHVWSDINSKNGKVIKKS